MSGSVVFLALALVGLAVLRVVLSRRRNGRVLHESSRGGTRVIVREDASSRELAFVGEGWDLVHTRVFRKDPRRSAWPYVDGFHLAALLAPAPRRALFIGCGGGIGPSQFVRAYPELAVEVVEIDAGIVELARRFFGFETSARLKVHVEDGAAFVERSGEPYDVIVLDAYDDGALLPPLSSAHFFERVRDRLAPNGALCVNVVGATRGVPLRRLVQAITTAFGGDAVAVFAIRGVNESALAMRTDVRRNHLAIVARGCTTFPLDELRRRASEASVPDAPLLFSAASWPVEVASVGDEDAPPP